MSSNRIQTILNFSTNVDKIDSSTNWLRFFSVIEILYYAISLITISFSRRWYFSNAAFKSQFVSIRSLTSRFAQFQNTGAFIVLQSFMLVSTSFSGQIP